MTAPRAASPSPLAACGALCAGAAVALAAYAAHAAPGAGQGLLQTAAALLFGHGVALAALGRGMPARRRRWALHALAGWPPRLAPFGGMLMIAGWLLLAFDLLRE